MSLTAKNAYMLEWWVNGCPEIDYDHNPHPDHKATLWERLALMYAARGRCEICLVLDKGLHGHVKLVVDHHHYDGSLRGMLCTRCNLMVPRYRTPAGLRGDAYQSQTAIGLHCSRALRRTWSATTSEGSRPRSSAGRLSSPHRPSIWPRAWPRTHLTHPRFPL